ncbi:PTS system mannose/fructose/sorbose family transporter subunit IID [Deferrisoma palaeochoriense]
MAAVRPTDLLRCGLRTLALQAAWSFGSFQSVGFAWAVEPALRRIHGQGKAYREALARHLEFFNTHPFLAVAVVGAVVRLEEDGAPADDIRRFKNAVMGPCGALGDSFFWAGLKPALLAGAVVLAWAGFGWGPWAFVAVFGGLGLAFRAAWLLRGYRRGPAVAQDLARAGFLRGALVLKDLAAACVGGGLVLALGRGLGGASGVEAWIWGVSGAVVAVVASQAVRRGLRVEWLVAAWGSACVILGVWW